MGPLKRSGYKDGGAVGRMEEVTEEGMYRWTNGRMEQLDGVHWQTVPKVLQKHSSPCGMNCSGSNA